MATSKSIRPAPGRARLPASRRSALSRPRHGTANGSLAAPPPLRLEQWRRLALVVPRLRGIYGAAVTAERALRQQEAEQDPEIADCLRDGVCDPIADQIRALEEVTAHSSATES
jgi:hypothetical protein